VVPQYVVFVLLLVREGMLERGRRLGFETQVISEAYFNIKKQLPIAG
jgi:hypothetical protein